MIRSIRLQPRAARIAEVSEVLSGEKAPGLLIDQGSAALSNLGVHVGPAQWMRRLPRHIENVRHFTSPTGLQSHRGMGMRTAPAASSAFLAHAFDVPANRACPNWKRPNLICIKWVRGWPFTCRARAHLAAAFAAAESAARRRFQAPAADLAVPEGDDPEISSPYDRDGRARRPRAATPFRALCLRGRGLPDARCPDGLRRGCDRLRRHLAATGAKADFLGDGAPLLGIVRRHIG